ncbi:MAG TPA: DUF2264 domain-containing protein [Planctomycetota bacterium]|nr:DUF2264 domain-containing protein [Planctomycetota bacterium]
MTNRRDFIKSAASLALLAGASAAPAHADGDKDKPKPNEDPGAADRGFWAATAEKLAKPVLESLAAGTLKQKLPHRGKSAEKRVPFAPLEAFGRLMTGLAPWLESQGLGGAEEKSRAHFAELARMGLAHATDPKSPDAMNFSSGQQPLVDTAFLAHALLRAPKELWSKLDAGVQTRVLDSLKASRAIKPGQNNWLLFSAMVEAALFRFDEKFERAPVETALKTHEKWYVGDGTYGDGPQLHWDYYNSFVIQPMLLEVLSVVGDQDPAWKAMLPVELKRAKRYAAIQERLIASDGSYPAIGRSITYRCGAFQLLALMALRRELPDGVSPEQVRCALSAVMRRTLEPAGTFDEDGWLQIGLSGHQPSLGEDYISGGSMYLCSAALLPLGLPPSDPFWRGSAQWTSQRIWSGVDMHADHAF